MDDLVLKQYALVMAEPVSDNHGRLASKWEMFLRHTAGAEFRSKNIVKIHENIWRIYLSSDMLLLSRLIALANECDVRLHTLILNDSIEWITSPQTGGKK